MAREATARIKINKLLEAAGWRFFANDDGPANIRLESQVTLRPADLEALGDDFQGSSKGYVDFLLLDPRGHPQIVLEAKAEDKDPLEGKEQARRYARSLNCPLVVLSNGNLHYLWDLHRGNPQVVPTIPTPQSALQRRRAYEIFPPNPERLVQELVGSDYVVLTQRPDYQQDAAWKNEEEREEFIRSNKLRFLRRYQQQAIWALQDAVKAGKDRFLFEMATGTGKTLVAAAVIKLFLRTGNAHRVLFLVDRLELERQAYKAFRDYLSNDYTTVIYKENRDDWQSAEIVVTTVQSLLFNNKYQRLFSPTDFDLVISDEAHRSINGNARAVFDYFIGYKLGLTATPRDYLKRFDRTAANDPREVERRLLLDTYRTFGCESGTPTFRYSLVDGVQDGYLVNPTVVDARTEITTQLLSERGWVVSFRDEEGEEQEQAFTQRDYERKVTSEATNRLFCETLMQHALRDPVSGEMGKSLVFAVSQHHAAKLAQILNELAERYYPGCYQSDFALQVTSNVMNAQQMTVAFANNQLMGKSGFRPDYHTSKTRVCVTVGMMTTGYDCTDVLNLALMRPVFSPTDFIQIKGRGTRRHRFTDDLFPVEERAEVPCPDKTTFKLFDFFASCQFFEHDYQYDQVLKLPALPSGEGSGEGGDEPTPSPDGYNYLGSDGLRTLDEQLVGPRGMKIDRMFFGDFEELVRADPVVVQAVEADQWERAVQHVQKHLFGRPEHYYTLDKLRKAAAVDRRISLREILEKVFGRIARFKTKDELLEEEFSKLLVDLRPDHAAVPALKHFFKAYLTSERVRSAIDEGRFTDLYTNPAFSFRDLEAVPPEYIRAVPEYIKDYVPLNQFLP